MSLPDKEPAELDVLYEPCTLLLEAKEMGSLLPGLQASAGYGQKPRQRPFLLGPVSDGDGFARRSDQAPAEGKLFITARARTIHNFSLKKTQAHDLSREQKRNFGDDIASQLRLARKKRWNVMEEKRICQEIELHSYLNRLIKKDVESRLEALKLSGGDSEGDEKEKDKKINSNNDEGEENLLEQKQKEIEVEGVRKG